MNLMKLKKPIIMNNVKLDLERYSRQIILDEIGEEGQKRLRESSVLIIGCGGLGSPAALYLAAAGVGRLGLVDKDLVSISNLQRQIIHSEETLETPKILSSKKMIEALNSDIIIETYQDFFQEGNAESLISRYDFVIDATDNFEAKFLINDTCVRLSKPFVHAGVMGFKGQVMTYVPGKGPCYRCIFSDVPKDDEIKNPAKLGILGTVTGIIGSIEATEAIKYILGIGDLLTGRLLTFDALTMKFREVMLPLKSADCPACGNN